MSSEDVVSVEYARILKRSGLPQNTEAYWHGVVPSLSTIQGTSAIATEDRNKMRWLLVLGKPSEPCASAFTLQELESYLKDFMVTNKIDKAFPEVKKVDKLYTCTIGDKDIATGTNKVNMFAQAILYLMRT